MNPDHPLSTENASKLPTNPYLDLRATLIQKLDLDLNVKNGAVKNCQRVFYLFHVQCMNLPWVPSFLVQFLVDLSSSHNK